MCKKATMCHTRRATLPHLVLHTARASLVLCAACCDKLRSLTCISTLACPDTTMVDMMMMMMPCLPAQLTNITGRRYGVHPSTSTERYKGQSQLRLADADPESRKPWKTTNGVGGKCAKVLVTQAGTLQQGCRAWYSVAGTRCLLRTPLWANMCCTSHTCCRCCCCCAVAA